MFSEWLVKLMCIDDESHITYCPLYFEVFFLSYLPDNHAFGLLRYLLILFYPEYCCI